MHISLFTRKSTGLLVKTNEAFRVLLEVCTVTLALAETVSAHNNFLLGILAGKLHAGE